MPFRRRRPPPPPSDPLAGVDPTAVVARYGPPVDDALRARAQFAGLVTATPDGPLQDRLRQLGERVDAGVLAVWRTARQATDLERVVGTLDPDRTTDELKRARRDGADPDVVQALADRFASIQRLLNALDDLRQRMPVLEARLATAVARAAEVALASPLASATTELAGLHAELDALVVELDALGRASAELG